MAINSINHGDKRALFDDQWILIAAIASMAGKHLQMGRIQCEQPSWMIQLHSRTSSSSTEVNTQVNFVILSACLADLSGDQQADGNDKHQLM